MAVLLALSTQNNNLKQQVSALAAQVQVLVTQTSSGFAETNFTMSQVRASVSSLEQKVGMAQTPNPIPHPPRNPQPAQPPARRQTTAPPANNPASQGQAQPRPSFANVAARAGATPVVDATPPKPQPLPTAQRRFFATRKVPKAFSDAPLLAGRLPVLVAKCLTALSCQAPLAFTATVNKVGTVSLTANEFTSAEVYVPYFDKLTAFLNDELALSSDGPLETFQLAPSGVDVAIHAIPLSLLSEVLEDDQALTQMFTDALSFSANVTPLQVRLLTPDAQKREGKTATTVVVTLSPDHARSLGSTVRLFSRARRVQILRTATATTHCTKCFGLGHHQTVCKQKHDTCPLCAKDHTHKAHKCFRKNEECPRGGHLRAVTGCCDVTPLLCINCKGAHAAFDPTCPKKLAAEEAVMKKLKEKAEAGVHRTHRRAGSNVEMHG